MNHNCSLSIKILCSRSHFHLLPEDWCHLLVQIKIKTTNHLLLFALHWVSVHLLQNSNPNSNTEDLPETRVCSLWAVGAISVIKTEGSQPSQRAAFVHLCNLKLLLSLLPLPKTAKQAWELLLPQDYDSKSHFIPAKAQSITADAEKGSYSGHTTSTALSLFLKTGELAFCRASTNYPHFNTELSQHSRLTPIPCKWTLHTTGSNLPIWEQTVLITSLPPVVLGL